MPCTRFCGHQVVAERFQPETEMVKNHGKIRGPPKSVGFIIEESLMSVQYFFVNLFSNCSDV